MFKKTFSVLFFLLLIFYADTAKQGAFAGLKLCFTVALPALFPFFVASTLLNRTGVIDSIGNSVGFIINKVYGLPKNCAGALLLGLLGGYPVGVSAACELYKSGNLTKKQTEHLLGFCNNTGPAFIIGVCGVGILGNIKIGILLYFIHMISAFITGKFFYLKSKNKQIKKDNITSDLPSAIVASCEQAAQTSIKVAAFLTFFSVIVALLHELNVFLFIKTFLSPIFYAIHIPPEIIFPICCGFIEITCGLNEFLHHGGFSYAVLVPVLSFILAFGGLSVIFQAFGIIKPLDISVKTCILGKLIHSIIALLIGFAVSPFLPKAVPTMSSFMFMPSLTIPYAAAFAFFILYILTTGKRDKNTL